MREALTPEASYVAIDELSIGMFVILELHWMDHPFAFNRFLIRSDEQIATLRGLGLTQVRIDPTRANFQARAPVMTSPPTQEGSSRPPPALSDEASANAAAEKARRIAQNRVLRTSMASAEREAAKAAVLLRDTTKRIFAEPARALGSATTLVADITTALLGNSETMVHLLNDRAGGEEIYYHSLNVTMLALLLGKAIGLDPETLRTLGVAAIFHDIGKEEVPRQILTKTEPLTHAEAGFLREHCERGARIAMDAGLPHAVIDAVLQHHENMDGSGYPKGLTGERIVPIARVIAVVNTYDNLCNPVDVGRAITPYEALSLMFAKRRGWFEPALLGKLIHLLGVYPPGSIVKLSNGATAMVVSVNPAKPLRPLLVVHDPAIPKDEAMILELEQHPEISISKAIRPADLVRTVYEYLSPRKRMTYYFDARGNPR